MHPKHVAIVTTSFPDGLPGSESAGSFVADFAECLSGFVNVTVVAPTLGLAKEERYGNMTVRRFVVPHLPLSSLNMGNPFHCFWILKTLRAGMLMVEHLAIEKMPDHILALWALPSGYWARKIGKRYSIPYSTWALGSDIWNMVRIPMVKGMLKKVLKGSYACFADGYLLRDDVERISGRSCEFLASTRKLPIEGKKKLSSAPPYRLAFLGRWHHNKGVDLLIESLKLLSAEDWDKIEEIQICGGGPLEDEVNGVCDSLRRFGRPIKIEGYLSKREAAALLMWADYLLIPSRIESIPVVFSDAMQAQCPVIALPVGDFPRILKEHNAGILASSVSSQAFASAVSLALSIPSQEFKKGMEETRNEFSIKETVSRFLSLVDPAATSVSRREK